MVDLKASQERAHVRWRNGDQPGFEVLKIRDSETLMQKNACAILPIASSERNNALGPPLVIQRALFSHVL